MQLNQLCPLCEEEGESINHFFKECRRTKNIWKKAKELEWIKEDPHGEIDSWIRNMRKYRGLEDKEEQKLAIAIVWSTWKSRNNKVFRNENFNTNGVLIRARSMVKECEYRCKLSPDAKENNNKHSQKEIYGVMGNIPNQLCQN